MEGRAVVDLFHNAGFDAMDFGFFNQKFYGVHTDSEEWKQYFLDIRAYAEEKGMIFNQAHAPFPSSVDDPIRNEEIFQNIVRSMKNASYLGIKTTIVHPMQHLRYYDDGAPERLFEMNMEFYNKLKPYCEEYNIKVALENMWQNQGGRKISHSTCSTPEEFIRYIDELNSDWFVACLDTGHACLVCEDVAEFIRKLGKKRLKALHVHDVDGLDDSHMLPGYGIINWNQVTAALKEIGYEGDFTFEVSRFLSRLPEETAPYAVKYTESVGRYLMKKIQE